MSYRRIIVVAILAANLFLGLAVFLLLRDFQDDAPGVTEANFNRIKKGMMLAEVRQIMGQEGYAQPVDWWLLKPGKDGKLAGPDLDNPDILWLGDHGALVVSFPDGLVGEKYWLPYPTESFFDKIGRWLTFDSVSAQP
jgi:hypothetical protein